MAGAFVELRGKGLVYGPPKARASLRTNALPEAIRPAIVEHLAKYVPDSLDAWLFTGERGNAMNDLSLLSDVNRWVCVVIAVAGSLVVAPSGTGLLWRSATDWLHQRKHQFLQSPCGTSG